MPVIAPPLKATFSGVKSLLCSFCGTHVGAYRDVHADETSQAREQGADGETDCSLPAECDENCDKQCSTDPCDGGVLPFQIGRSTFLHCSRNALHLLAAGR
jgi:hypothetical protein